MAGAHCLVRTAPKLTLRQHFNRSACFQLNMGILFHMKFKQWARVGIILITCVHGFIFL